MLLFLESIFAWQGQLLVSENNHAVIVDYSPSLPDCPFPFVHAGPPLLMFQKPTEHLLGPQLSAVWRLSRQRPALGLSCRQPLGRCWSPR